MVGLSVISNTYIYLYLSKLSKLYLNAHRRQLWSRVEEKAKQSSQNNNGRTVCNIKHSHFYAIKRKHTTQCWRLKRWNLKPGRKHGQSNLVIFTNKPKRWESTCIFKNFTFPVQSKVNFEYFIATYIKYITKGLDQVKHVLLVELQYSSNIYWLHFQLIWMSDDKTQQQVQWNLRCMKRSNACGLGDEFLNFLMFFANQ